MRAVFGHPFSLLWFSPFSTPDHGKAETYQYVVWGSQHREFGGWSEPKWKSQPSPTECSYGSPFAPTAQHDLHCMSHTSHGQRFLCFFCVANQVHNMFIFVLPWVSWVAEKKKLSICESCLPTLWWICFISSSSLFVVSKASLFLPCGFSYFPLECFQPPTPGGKKGKTTLILSLFWWCLAMQMVLCINQLICRKEYGHLWAIDQNTSGPDKIKVPYWNFSSWAALLGKPLLRCFRCDLDSVSVVITRMK